MKKGFTLIELLIVIVIIGVLSTLLMANFVGVRARARDGVRKGDLRQIQQALEFYRTDKGQYPSALAACGTTFIDGSTTYMQTVPCDPTTKTSYIYHPSGSPQTFYCLRACLENLNDMQLDSKSGVTIDSRCTATACATVDAKYTLQSP